MCNCVYQCNVFRKGIPSPPIAANDNNLESKNALDCKPGELAAAKTGPTLDVPNKFPHKYRNTNTLKYIGVHTHRNTLAPRAISSKKKWFYIWREPKKPNCPPTSSARCKSDRWWRLPLKRAILRILNLLLFGKDKILSTEKGAAIHKIFTTNFPQHISTVQLYNCKWYVAHMLKAKKAINRGWRTGQSPSLQLFLILGTC